MRPAESADDFLAAPVGRYVADQRFLYWCADPTLYGFRVWGAPGEDEVRRLARLLEVEVRPGALPHQCLVDLRGLTRVDPTAFAVLAQYLEEREEILGRFVLRQALVRPAGMVGSLVAGFYEVLGTTYPVKTFVDLGKALGWIGRGKNRELRSTLDALEATSEGTDPAVRRLRDLFEVSLTQLNLKGAARKLGLSERSLQRRLRDAGTTFQGELNAAQVRRAQHLLLDSDQQLTAVAFEVGCSSLQHFSNLFRRLAGEPPSTWRARHRKAQPRKD